MIVGRWSSNDLLGYIRIHVSDFSKGISDLMVTTHDFYIISDAETIC